MTSGNGYHPGLVGSVRQWVIWLGWSHRTGPGTQAQPFGHDGHTRWVSGTLRLWKVW